MSDRSFSRRRRGMRFRPSGGLGHGQPNSNHEAVQARAEAVNGQPAPERVYDPRHQQEIERAENISVGLPPEGLPVEPAETPGAKADFREPHAEPPAPQPEEECL